MGGLTWWLGLFLGSLLVIAGVAETVRALKSGDGGLWFWTPTLVGGGGLLLAGTVLLPGAPVLGSRLVYAGTLLGFVPTAWTIVVPVLLGVLVVAVAKQVRAVRTASTTG